MQFCFAKGNEKDFIAIAEKLGIKELCFAYDNAKDIKEMKSSKIKILKAQITFSQAG